MNASQIARTLGRKGGLARAKKLSKEQRKKIASLGGRTKALSAKAQERIESNFRFAETLKLLRPAPKVKSVSHAKRPLPGVYADSK